jgi:hypothetical protein
MFLRLLARTLCCALLAGSAVHATERNLWPFVVEQRDSDGSVASAEYLGPLFFHQTDGPDASSHGFRPLYAHIREKKRESDYILYPFFAWHREGEDRSFSFFQLANTHHEHDPGSAAVSGFDVWPLYFSLNTGDPATSYRAFFPGGGTIKRRLGYDRLHFVLFPLYLETEKRGTHVVNAPWPFLRFIDGAGDHGFEFWPLFGHRGRPGDYDSQFYLWPLIYKSTDHLSEPEPDVKFGVLPFYTRETAPGYRNENFVWPFFGYSDRTFPERYHERRYLWPLLVQGRGNVRYVNRWAPLYSHSIIKGYDKTWVGWPLFRHARWTEGKVAQEQNQFLFFVYWSLTQRSTTNPAAAPAYKTHFWPLVSAWDNGAGQRQVQLLSPFEVLFPNNEPIRQLYTPLFSLYRYDQRAPGDVRVSALFRLFTWKRTPEEKEFHFGPLFSTQSDAASARVTIGNGLLAWSRNPGITGWRFSLFDFRPKSANKSPDAPSP